MASVQMGVPGTSMDSDLESQQHSPELGTQEDGHERSPTLASRGHQGGSEGEEEDTASVAAKPERAKALPWYHLVVLVSLTVLAPFSMDAYVPSMEAMREEFNTTEVLMGLSLQINMMVSGISTVFLGHLSDHIGRRPVLLLCVAFHILGNCLCAVAPTVEMLLVARAIQGIGAGSGPLPAAVVRDVIDDPDEFMRIASLFGALRPAANIVAPMVGGPLAAGFGWRSVFWLTTAWACLTLVLAFAMLPETLALKQQKRRGGNTEEAPGNAAEAPGEAENRQHTAVASTSLHEAPRDVGTDSDVGVLPGGSSGDLPAVGGPGSASASTASEGAPGWRSKLRRLCCDRLVTGSMLSFTMLFSAIISMLSNISFVLGGDYNLGETLSGVLIGSVPGAMFIPPILVGLVSYRGVSPLAVLRTGMGFGMMVAAAACAVALLAADHLWLFMAIMYGLVVTESTVAPAMNSLFLLKLKDIAGLACSVQDGLRNFACAGIAVAVTKITGLYQAAGLLVALAVLLASSSTIFWASFGLRPPQLVLEATCSREPPCKARR